MRDPTRLFRRSQFFQSSPDFNKDETLDRCLSFSVEVVAVVSSLGDYTAGG